MCKYSHRCSQFPKVAHVDPFAVVDWVHAALDASVPILTADGKLPRYHQRKAPVR